MFARRLAKSSSLNGTSILRTFSSSASLSRSPALSDVSSTGAAAFDAKQKQFREKVAEDSKQKELSQSKESSSFSPYPSHYYTLPDAFPVASKNEQGAEKKEASSQKGVETGTTEHEHESGKKGALSSLIYGTKEGRQMDREIEHSFSQVLARGKYVHSIVFHQVKPDKVDEYVELVGKWYPKMAGMEENKVHLVGSWRTEVGDCDTFGTSPLPLMNRLY